MTPTLSEKTKSHYLVRHRQLHDRFARENNQETLSPDELVAYLILLKPTLCQRTWRAYKSACVYALELLHGQHEAAIELLRGETSEDLPRTSLATSGTKAKHVPTAAWNAIKAALNRRARNNHVHAKPLLDFLEATLLTGLRPVEWCNARIAIHAPSQRQVLRVKNAKHTNGRANGEYRELFIDELSEADREVIEKTIAHCQVNEDEAPQLLKALSNEMAICRDSALVRRYDQSSSVTLYSFRHQFIADAKASLDDPVIISAMVGHSSTKTAFEHYGKKRFGLGRIRVLPTPESIEQVMRVRLETYKSYVAQRNRVKLQSPL